MIKLLLEGVTAKKNSHHLTNRIRKSRKNATLEAVVMKKPEDVQHDLFADEYSSIVIFIRRISLAQQGGVVQRRFSCSRLLMSVDCTCRTRERSGLEEISGYAAKR